MTIDMQDQSPCSRLSHRMTLTHSQTSLMASLLRHDHDSNIHHLNKTLQSIVHELENMDAVRTQYKLLMKQLHAMEDQMQAEQDGLEQAYNQRIHRMQLKKELEAEQVKKQKTLMFEIQGWIERKVQLQVDQGRVTVTRWHFLALWLGVLIAVFLIWQVRLFVQRDVQRMDRMLMTV